MTQNPPQVEPAAAKAGETAPGGGCASQHAAVERFERLIVAIDGPAGTGKSSVARALAARLGLDFLDTGAMYRAAAAIAIDKRLDPKDHDAVVAAVQKEDLHFDWKRDPPELLCSGRSVMHRIRDADVTLLVSPISAIADLRRHMVRKQQLIARQHPRLVAEGRDQGSVVFPDADVKFYLHASAGVRARRRAEQLRAAGQTPDVHALEEDIRKRDWSDSHRRDGPLMCPPDATRIDTSAMTFEEVVDELERLVILRLSGPTPTIPRCATPAPTA